MNKTILIMLICLTILSCNQGYEVVFSEPQPKGIRPIAKFPKEIFGEYYNIVDSSRLTISSDLIVKSVFTPVFLSVNDLDSNYEINGNNLKDKSSKKTVKVKIINDTVYYLDLYSDTIFKLNSDFVLKKFKGRFFLNEKFIDNSWAMKQFIYDNGKLSISYISADSVNFQKLKSIDANINDTILPILMKPSKREFKKLLNEEVFKNSDFYIKIR